FKGAWFGRLSRTSTAGAAMAVVVRGAEVFLVGRVGRLGGRATVTYATLHKTISFRATHTRNRVVLVHFRRTRVCAARKPRKCRGVRPTDRATLRVVSLGGGRVNIDAIGFR
ncbi:MAG: hypothetical protein JOZ25_09925, partial [Actinobacteria bacterium]|nr:hypothetical protein [Actinomycetota bacterium]